MYGSEDTQASCKPDEARTRQEVYESFPDIYCTIPILERYLSAVNTCRQSTLRQSSDLHILSTCMVNYATLISRRSTRFSKALCQPQKQIVTLVSSAKQLEARARCLDSLAQAMLSDFERLNNTATRYFEDLSCGELQIISEMNRLGCDQESIKQKRNLKHEHYHYFIGEQKEVDAIVTQFSTSFICRLLASSKTFLHDTQETHSRDMLATPESMLLEEEHKPVQGLPQSSETEKDQDEHLCAECGLPREKSHLACSDNIVDKEKSDQECSGSTRRSISTTTELGGSVAKGDRVKETKIRVPSICDDALQLPAMPSLKNFESVNTQVREHNKPRRGKKPSESNKPGVHFYHSQVRSSDNMSDVLHVPSDLEAFHQLLRDAKNTEALISALPESPQTEQSDLCEMSQGPSRKPPVILESSSSQALKTRVAPARVLDFDSPSGGLGQENPSISTTHDSSSKRSASYSTKQGKSPQSSTDMSHTSSDRTTHITESDSQHIRQRMQRFPVHRTMESTDSDMISPHHKGNLSKTPRNWNSSTDFEYGTQATNARPSTKQRSFFKAFRTPPRLRCQKIATQASVPGTTNRDDKLQASRTTCRTELQLQADVLRPPKPFVTDVDSDSSVGHWYHM